MLQLLLYINLAASKYLLIENINIEYNFQKEINKIQIAAIFQTSIQSGYLSFYGLSQNYQEMNEITCVVQNSQTMNVMFENKIEFLLLDEYFFKLNSELKNNTLYYISIRSNNSFRDFQDMILIKTISISGELLDYYVGLGIANNINQQELVQKNVYGMLFNIQQRLNFQKYEIKSHNSLKLYFYSNCSAFGINITININQNVKLNYCWVNLSNYSCVEKPDELQVIVSQLIQESQLIEFLFEFSDDLNNRIQQIQVHYSQQYLKITPTQLLEQKFVNISKQSSITKFRLLQDFNEFSFENFSISNDQIEQLIHQLNFEGRQDQCNKTDKADEGNQTVCSKFFHHYNSINQDLNISESELQSNNYNSLNFSDQILFSKTTTQNVKLNLTNVTQGQIMWYEVINNSTKDTTSQIVVENQLQSFTSQALKQFVNINQTVSWNGSFLMQNISGLFQSSYLIDGQILLDYSNSNFTNCLALGASVIGNFSTITSICNLNNTSYVLFSNIGQTNYSKLININPKYQNYTMKNEGKKQNYNSNEDNEKPKSESQKYQSILFTDIKKIFQIQTYIFVLGKTSQEPIFQIYVFNLTQESDELFFKEINRIFCLNSIDFFEIENYLNNTIFDSNNTEFDLLSNITDFNMTILQNKSISFNNTYSARGVIFYICENPNELRYRGFDFVNTTQLIMHHISPRFNDQITCCLQNNTIKLQQVFIYTVKFDQLILFVTSNASYSIAYMMSFTPLIDQNEILQIEMPIAIIPPYFTFIQSAKAVLNHDFLVLLFKAPEEQSIYSLAIYDLKKVFNPQSMNQTSYSSNNYWPNFTYMIAGTQNLSLQNQSIVQLAIVNQSLSKGSIIMGILKDEKTGNTSIFTYIFNQNLSLEIHLNLNNNESYLLVGHNAFNQSLPSQLPIKGPKQLKVYIIILSCSLLILIALCSFLVIQFKKKVIEIEQKFEQLNPDKEIEMK